MRTSLSLGDLTVVVNPRFVHISIVPAARAPRVAPMLYGGQRAEHLTIPFEPRRGCLEVHLTWPDRHHETIARIPVGALQGVFARLQEDLFQAWLPEVKAVTESSLATDGYALVRLSDRVQRSIKETVEQPPRHLRVRESMIRALPAEVELLEPSILADLAHENPGHVIHALNMADSGPSELILGEFVDGPWGEAGWYGYRGDWLNSEKFIAMFARHAGPTFVDVAYVALRELGLDPDQAKLDDLRRRFNCVEHR